MEDKLLDFDVSPEPCIKIPVDLASKVQQLLPEEKLSGRVTMEVLKYVVYEQAEEINEEWIAYKEPSDFMDEVTIAIYKAGEAPPEVLEEINKGELPEEAKGQQRAMQEATRKAQEQKMAKSMAEQQRLALKSNDQDTDGDFAALNQQKRDRRTIEDYEREAKMGRTGE